MKRFLLLLLAVFLCGCSIPRSPSSEESTSYPIDPERTVRNYRDFKAIWISQFDLAEVYLKNGAQRPKDDYTDRIADILTRVASLGFNTVILQMRPYADSMYPSDYYPMSRMVVGEYGKEAAYDPVAIAVEEAHKRELSVQAWINPMRAMTDAEIGKVNDRYLIKQWYLDPTASSSYIGKVGSRWYLNPAHAEVRQLILDGARELLKRYPVDGLHMDDYFYPDGVTETFDRIAYEARLSGGASISLADWRREQLNLLVKGLYDTVKDVDGRLLFGISPAGNYNTVFQAQFADIYTWCGHEGYLDYICPQIYFGMEHGSYDFAKVATAYQDMIKIDSVKLIVGMTLGKAFAAYNGEEDQWAGSGKTEWIEHHDVLLRELSYTKTLPTCHGVAYFSYQYFFDPMTGEPVIETEEERDRFLPLLKTVSWS